MDYFGLLKRAWNITWRYKALWVLGFFAGAMGGGGSGGSGSGGSGFDTGAGDFGSAGGQIARWVETNIALLVVLVGVLVVIGIALWILSIAAQGGIAHGTNEAAEGRAPALGDAWSVGFSRWGRTLMIQLLLGLPLVVILLTFSFVALASTAGGLVSENPFGVAAGSVGLCFVAPLLVVVLIAAAVIVGIITPVAIRYGVLRDMTFGVAIKQAWSDLWAKKGLVVFWLVMLLPGLAFGIAIAIVVVPVVIVMVPLAISEQYVVIAVIAVVLMLALMVPSAIYATFVHAAWTLFFRHLAGMEPAEAPAMPAYPASGPDLSADAPPYGAPAADGPTGDAPLVDAPLVDVPPADAPPSDE